MPSEEKTGQEKAGAAKRFISKRQQAASYDPFGVYYPANTQYDYNTNNYPENAKYLLVSFSHRYFEDCRNLISRNHGGESFSSGNAAAGKSTNMFSSGQ